MHIRILGLSFALPLFLTACVPPRSSTGTHSQIRSTYVQVIKDAHRVGAEADQVQRQRESLLQSTEQ